MVCEISGSTAIYFAQWKVIILGCNLETKESFVSQSLISIFFFVFLFLSTWHSASTALFFFSFVCLFLNPIICFHKYFAFPYGNSQITYKVFFFLSGLLHILPYYADMFPADYPHKLNCLLTYSAESAVPLKLRQPPLGRFWAIAYFFNMMVIKRMFKMHKRHIRWHIFVRKKKNHRAPSE